ncbi:uncharacterized protein LOC109831031 [Asparagus officinalis]|uniref:uncharacterized protein LOC109831031 n=1 Tax=Asparagus officinalis TaxID=4686 RepID=UPI00098E0D6B|nr:uncharacterized protein LOC109831031 [Asparagus officinalis]
MRTKFMHERPVGSVRIRTPKRKKTIHKPHTGQRTHRVELGSTIGGEEGNHDEGELPQDSVFPDSDHLDSFVQQMCYVIHDKPMDVDANMDTEQVNSDEPTILCLDNLKNPNTDVRVKESSATTAERPVEDEAFHDIGFEEQAYVSAPSFSGSDIRLLVDMLAEQATRWAAGPSFEGDSSAGPATGTDTVTIPGISSLSEGDGPAVTHNIRSP